VQTAGGVEAMVSKGKCALTAVFAGFLRQLRPRFSKNNHFPQKQAAAKVYHCYAILTLFAKFRLQKTKSVDLVNFGKVGENLENWRHRRVKPHQRRQNTNRRLGWLF
jgi:hypothetical protein